VATLYKLQLSDKTKMSEVAKSAADSALMTIREVELLALESMLNIAASNQKDVKKINEAYDLIDQIKNLTDDKTFISVTKSDLEQVERGIELSSGQRSPMYFWARQLFKSIEKREEVVVE
jgi:hypothetical protein